jgi:hypothetical protein
MSRVVSFGVAGLVAASVFAFTAAEVSAQGCTGSNLEAPGGVYDPEGVSYFVKKGDWRASFGVRGFRSHRHFVGSVEQNAANVANGTAERDRSGTEVINHSYISVLSAAYGVSDRLTLSAEVPYVKYLRKSPARGARPLGRTEAQGIGDVRLGAQYWLWDPAGSHSGNLQLGLGLKLPTGDDRAEDDFVTVLDDGTIGFQRRPVDFSIMPGDGGLGIITSVQGFKSLGRVTAFASGSYLFSPQEQNDYLRNPFNDDPDPTSAYYTIADQFAARVGVGTSVGKLGLILAARLEGVPSSDLIGGDLGRRRPGYSIGIEPGLSYSIGPTAISVSIPILVRRVRNQNVSDKLESLETGHFETGDAAFADYVVLGGVSYSF